MLGYWRWSLVHFVRGNCLCEESNECFRTHKETEGPEQLQLRRAIKCHPLIPRESLCPEYSKAQTVSSNSNKIEADQLDHGRGGPFTHKQ